MTGLRDKLVNSPLNPRKLTWLFSAPDVVELKNIESEVTEENLATLTGNSTTSVVSGISKIWVGFLDSRVSKSKLGSFANRWA